MMLKLSENVTDLEDIYQCLRLFSDHRNITIIIQKSETGQPVSSQSVKSLKQINNF